MLTNIRLPARLRPMKLGEVRRATESPMDAAEDSKPTIEDLVDTAEKLGVPVPDSLLAPPAAVPSEAVVNESSELFKETLEEITPLKPIERVLAAQATAYESRWDRKYSYFKVEITGLGPDVLTVMPKDVILMQDCSASMAERRLFFCRQGINACLEILGDDDRFEVIAFRQKDDRCFGSLVDNEASNIAKARKWAYGSEMYHGGCT